MEAAIDRLGIWIYVLFPIPFLPLFNAPYDPVSIQVVLIIVALVSIPFSLLALFMNDGSANASSLN